MAHMGFRMCPQCNSSLTPQATKCPHCGAVARGGGGRGRGRGRGPRKRGRGPVRVPASAKFNPNVVWMWVGLGLAGVLVLIAFLAYGESDQLRGERRLEQEIKQQERNRQR